MWEFPGGKVEINESPEDALVREIREELCLDIEVGPLVGEETFQYPSRTLRLRVYEASVVDAKLQLIEHDDFQWVTVEDLDPSVLSEPDRPFVQKLLELMPQKV
ncbi:CTP pyrophosphohydrolase [compost metagenome]